jgi:hypothetical protein
MILIACCQVPPVYGSLVRLSFSHVPGRSYGLWDYSRGEPGSQLNGFDGRIRQLLHSCDSCGGSPLQFLLSKSVDRMPQPRLNLHVSMLISAKFGSSDSVGNVPLHFALECGVNEGCTASHHNLLYWLILIMKVELLFTQLSC